MNACHTGFKTIQFVSSEPSILSKLGFHYIKTHQPNAVNWYHQDMTYYVFDGTKAGTPKLQTQNKNNFMYNHSTSTRWPTCWCQTYIIHHRSYIIHHTDIIQHQNFGQQKAQLLSIVPVRAEHRVQKYWKCDPPFYLPLKTSELDSIEIKIDIHIGELFPFTPDTNVIIRLHFTRKPHTI